VEKLDLKKSLKEFYSPSAKDVSLVAVPRMNFLMIDGEGAPESLAFQQAIEAIYGVAYTLKFTVKKAGGQDFAVMPLEGLWWAEDMADFDPQRGDRNRWCWKLLIMQPDFITPEDFEGAAKSAAKKKDNPAINRVRLDSLEEGRTVQIMHIGPFSTEGPNIKRLHDKIAALGSRPAGKHHEIYLSDFRRVSPAAMKTVLRQPYA
jgi:hypothetical protein